MFQNPWNRKFSMSEKYNRQHCKEATHAYAMISVFELVMKAIDSDDKTDTCLEFDERN